MSINPRDIEHIFERLRSGVVPDRGLEAFAVGIDMQRGEVHRQLTLASDNEGTFKFLRGGYGCGKTFMSRLALLDAQAQGFATSFVVVSDNDLHFHRFDDVYRKVVQELGTASCERGALSDIIDRWIARVEDALVATGADVEAEDFDQKVQARIEEDLASLTALLSWLSGSENVAGSAKRLASIKGDIGSREALDYLQGILEITKAAGYKGLVIVIDEVETILRMRHDVRGKSLNGIRQICDAADRYRGLFWVFTGTPEFFDTNRGVAGLPPLHDRIKFLQSGSFANPRQPQLALQPFNAERLREVAMKLRELYPIEDRMPLIQKVTPVFIDRLVANVTAGFRGDVGVVPRQFLRQFVNILDLAATFPDFDPMTAEGLAVAPAELNAEELRIQQGLPAFIPEPEDEKTYELVEF
jgi:hypothetical protein